MACLAFGLSFAWAGATTATEYNPDPSEEEHIPSPIRDLFVVRSGENLDPRIMTADLDFTANMARHHQGAVEMALLYLEDPRGTNPMIRRLAQAIIANQRFEIALLNDVQRHIAGGPKIVATFGDRRVLALDRGTDGLEHVWQFTKAPPPTMIDVWLTRNLMTSDFDVQFARPMIRHHEAALDMARAYNTNPVSNNLILRALNLDIMIDQKYEISFMRALLSRYPDDTGRVPDDPRMMEAMHRSMSGMSGGHFSH